MRLPHPPVIRRSPGITLGRSAFFRHPSWMQLLHNLVLGRGHSIRRGIRGRARAEQHHALSPRAFWYPDQRADQRLSGEGVPVWSIQQLVSYSPRTCCG
jgi:hypothetical protein